jgi:hypothetical protein
VFEVIGFAQAGLRSLRSRLSELMIVLDWGIQTVDMMVMTSFDL